MAIFTSFVALKGPVKIFARRDAEVQHLILELSCATENQTALVVPIPGKVAVSVVELSKYSEIFVDLDRAFPRNCQTPNDARLVEKVKSVTTHVVTDQNWSSLPSKLRLPDEFWNNFTGESQVTYLLIELPDTLGNVVTIYPQALSWISTSSGEQLYFPLASFREYVFKPKVKQDFEIYYQGPKLELDDYTSSIHLDQSVDINFLAKISGSNVIDGGKAFKRVPSSKKYSNKLVNISS